MVGGGGQARPPRSVLVGVPEEVGAGKSEEGSLCLRSKEGEAGGGGRRGGRGGEVKIRCSMARCHGCASW